ncbi:MAG: DedA family protein [Rhodobacteraceae bacterium]|jgi:membrane protein YqaA with SNARE-associated domain|nr:DedA family protein [Paracoccaceae bacterium]
MWENAGLTGLFTAAFLAATPIPFQSEIVFIAAQAAAIAPVWLLIAVASVGNTLGSCVTFVIGRQITRFQHRGWFPATPAQMRRAQDWFQRWGRWSLLLSWAPFGDAIVLASGVLRTPWPVFLSLVAIAKTGRYLALAGAVDLLV